MAWLTSGPTLRSGLPVRLALCGLVLGMGSACVISVNDGEWGDDPEQCFEHYDDCLEDALPFGEHAIDACGDLLDDCLAACDDKADSGETGSDSSDSNSGDSAGDDSSSGDGDGDSGDPGPRPIPGDGDGDGGSTGDGDGDAPNEACFDLLATCAAEAQTIQDIEACEALFDNCINPGPCDDPGCEPGCPQEELDACVGNFAGCAAAASSEAEALICEEMFDSCVALFDVSECLPNYDDMLLQACLEQHGLCMTCAHTPEEIAACTATFDNCLEG